MKWPAHLLTVLAMVCCCLVVRPALAADSGVALEVRTVSVDGKPVRLASDHSARLPPFPENVTIGFNAVSDTSPDTIRVRYKLEGYDTAWHEGLGEMYLVVRFFNDTGDQIAQTIYKVNGESLGWNGSLASSPLTHRRETLVVPPHASKVWVVISSGGPPSTIGIYVVANLTMSRASDNSPATEIIRSPFDRHVNDGITNVVPDGWMRDGIHSSMAKIVEFGQHPQTKALAILDEDPISHAEWHTTKETAPDVAPGDSVTVEWDEMYSMGGNSSTTTYAQLPPGNFKFVVEGMNALGIPTGVSASMEVMVLQPFWKTLWFWTVASLIFLAIMAGSARYFVWHRMKQEMMRLKQQRALEQERLRIAHDIHDDLGARVTQICLVSAMAQDDHNFPEKARADFDKISKMSRELVSALYETVWAVNPENDNLDALGNYLCQMVNQLCERTSLRCRFHVLDLPHEVQVSSQTRHNISMAVKEAVHNVIKHARASELTIRLTFQEGFLTVTVADDGCGFQPENGVAGNGLINMRQRLENIGGNCVVTSSPGQGTTVELRLAVKPAEKTS